MLVELEQDNLKEIVDRDGTVFVQYSAGWCGNCRIMKPKFKRFAKDMDGATFVIVDAEKNPESRALAKVDNLPTFASFKNGELVKQVQTNKTDVLKGMIDEVADN
jgi:thiol-disulfide isomerase/thioredoxin